MLRSPPPRSHLEIERGFVSIKHQQAAPPGKGLSRDRPGVTMTCMTVNGRCAFRAGVCRLGMLGEGYAQAAVPRDVRPGRATENPIPLLPETRGLTYVVDATTEVLANLAGGTTRTAVWESLLIAGVEVDFEEAAGMPGLSLTVSGLYAGGSGLTNKAVHDFNTLSNIDAYDSIRLYEAWLQQEIWDGQFSIRLGQILADAEFFVSDHGELFINSSFGAIPLVSQNLDPPIFPVAAPGLRLRAAPNESFYASRRLQR